MAEECALVVSPNPVGMQAEFWEAKFYIESFTDKSLYAGNLEWQAANDFFQLDANGNPTYHTVHTVGLEMHEGWNYFDIPPNTPYYRVKYR